jgi:Protein of unknown function (DUF4239)
MRHLRRLWKHGFFLTLAVLGQLAVRASVPAEALRSANDVGGNVLQTFGSFYGIIIAFAMYVVWQQHLETQNAIEREAVALREVWTMLAHFDSLTHRDELRARLREYARVVPLLNGASPQACARDDKSLLSSTLAEFLRHEPSLGHEERLFQMTLDLFHELNEAREHRITSARLRLPEGIRGFIVIGGAITVVSLWLLYVDAAVLHSVMVMGMTWVVVAAGSIIFDLDDPYRGDFVVDWKRFTDAEQRMSDPEDTHRR